MVFDPPRIFLRLQIHNHAYNIILFTLFCKRIQKPKLFHYEYTIQNFFYKYATPGGRYMMFKLGGPYGLYCKHSSTSLVIIIRSYCFSTCTPTVQHWLYCFILLLTERSHGV